MGNNAIVPHVSQLDEKTMLALIAGGDCGSLTPAQRLAYYNARCEAAGLDPRAQPFSFINLQGKTVLYALKAATDQLASKHGIVCTITDQRTEDGIRVVTVKATAKDGRSTDEIGAVPVTNLKGTDLCNAMMKAVTKAKRRAILSLAGLGMMDETELDTVPDARPLPAEEAKAAGEVVKAALAADLTAAQKKERLLERAQELAGMSDSALRTWLAGIYGRTFPEKHPIKLHNVAELAQLEAAVIALEDDVRADNAKEA